MINTADPQSADTSKQAQILQQLFCRLLPDVIDRGEGDTAYFVCLVQDFGQHIDLSGEMKKFQAWQLDQPQPLRSNYRSRFRQWLSTDHRRSPRRRPHDATDVTQ